MTNLCTRIIMSSHQLLKLEPHHFNAVRGLRGVRPEEAKTLQKKLEGNNKVQSTDHFLKNIEWSVFSTASYIFASGYMAYEEWKIFHDYFAPVLHVCK